MSQHGFTPSIPFVSHLGFVLEAWEGGDSVLRYAPRPEHLNSFGVTHGGACMTLLDVAMAVAARSLDKSQGVVTIEIKTSFLRPSRVEIGALQGLGHVLHRTRSMAFVEGRIIDAEGQVCAHATGTFKYVKRADDAASAASPVPTD